MNFSPQLKVVNLCSLFFTTLSLGIVFTLTFTTQVAAQSNAIYCSEPQFLTTTTSQNTQAYFLGDKTKLTHFQNQNTIIPRLVTVKKRPFPNFLGQTFFIKEGGNDGLLGTQDDIETQLNSTVLNNMVSPRIGDFEIHSEYLIFTARDYPPSGSSGPAVVVIAHLSFGGVIHSQSTIVPQGEFTLATYPFINTPNFISDPLVPDVNIDSDGTLNTSQLPLVSWVHSYNQMHSQNGDDLYYCRIDQCNNPIAVNINQSQWAGILNGSVTEHTSTNTIASVVTPLINLNNGNFSYDKGVFAKDLAQNPSIFAWLDNLLVGPTGNSPLEESFADNFGNIIFYLAPSSSTQLQPRLNWSFINLPPSQNLPLFSHVNNSTWRDSNLKVSKVYGFSTAGFFSNPPQQNEIFFGWDHVGSQINASNGFKVTQSQSMLSFIGQNSSPQSLSQIVNAPTGFFTYLRGISRNLVVVSTLPSPSIYGASFPNYFKNQDNELVSFFLYCSN